jgi:photosystem II stability/assembly factor-like uncharacterized protein
VGIYHSADGGASWTLLAEAGTDRQAADGLPFGGSKSGVTFQGSRAWVTGFSPMEGSTYVFTSADSGKTWQPLQLALPAGQEKSMLTVEPPRFFDEKHAVMLARATGDPSAQIFYRSQDGGSSWTPSPPVTQIGLVSLVSAQDWVIWDGGALRFTHDAGQTWPEIAPDINLDQKITALQFIDLQNGWALSMEGETTRLYRTGDGGKTWQ